MTEKELDGWFCSLPIVRKNHIASKMTIKKEGNCWNGGKVPPEVIKAKMYPHCTGVWMELRLSDKQWIHDHCTNDHGDCIQEGGDAPIFSY